MADEPENHTIRLLRELRDEMRVEFAMIGKRFEKVDERFDEMDRRFDGVSQRIDGVTHVLMLRCGPVARPRGPDRQAGRRHVASSAAQPAHNSSRARSFARTSARAAGGAVPLCAASRARQSTLLT